MKKFFTVSSLFFISITSRGQNLVPNGSFELYSGCPTYYTQIDCVLFWTNTAQWPGPGGSPDYFNQCAPAQYVGVPANIFGYQNAYNGNAYAGIILWDMNTLFREYIQVPLTSTLSQNLCCHFEMYVCLANKYKYAADAIGVYFSDIPITGTPNFLPLPFTPQINSAAGFMSDTLNWMLISGNYTASGTENYLIIGNFKNDANTNSLLVNNSGIYDQSYIYLDQVSLTACTSVNEQSANGGINIYHDPANDLIIINIPGIQNSTCLNIFDISGRKILQKNISAANVSVDIKNFAGGIYFVELVNACLADRQGKNSTRKKILKR